MTVVETANQTERFQDALRREAGAYGVSLSAEALAGLARYYQLLNIWNARVHLVAPCTPQEFATRHVLESLTLLKHLPAEASVAEVGAGAGLPILPCVIVRPDLRAVLIEASKKKAVFLREALTTTETSARASVINERFETVVAPQVDFVSCRALDRFDDMLPHLLAWAPAKATLLLFGGMRLGPRVENAGFTVRDELMPHSKNRFLFVVKKL
ncbi:MAG TPA: RsmG family class I SAM-dependent methyltransferase [Pyrinomonadaceae bacterium]|jgi:16S rRNA (guanine527-N7)-methyltransferase|nr:RsmG family class I SAM-dependent methyltransferase [Pyrinomonadaceae bacterium]